MKNDLRIGLGYDAHRLGENTTLILGGVEIAHSKGLIGHSDADVLVHAIIDSLLGALALGDIGNHFPDWEAKYKDAVSIDLLRQVYRFIDEAGYEIVNIDSVIVAQKPCLAAYIQQMRKNIAGSLNTVIENISIKATTEETMGFTGREEGISAQAVCLLRKTKQK